MPANLKAIHKVRALYVRDFPVVTTPATKRIGTFRPLPPCPATWLQHTFPTYFQNAQAQSLPLAAHHEEYWRWLWSLRAGQLLPSFIGIWGRGGGKSMSVELGGASAGHFGLRRYGLYISATQQQCDDHVQNVATMLETLGVERALNTYGMSRGWRINRLRTADGFTLDAVGMDAAMRGVRIDEARPDLIILDDLDDEHDTTATIEKKIKTLTRKILPTGGPSLTVLGVQNIPNADGIFAQLADGRAEFLLDRIVSGPHPALADLPETDWYGHETTPDGSTRIRLKGGIPTWAGQGIAECEALIAKIGPTAFLVECQHKTERLAGTMFQRHWFPIVTDWPRSARRIRCWDLAGTEPSSHNTDPDWTVGGLIAEQGGQYWVINVQRFRLTPKKVEDRIAQQAALDGTAVEILIEQEPGSPLWIEERVLLATGEYGRLGDIQKGDEIIGKSGKACRVLGVHDQGALATLCLHMHSGRTVIAAAPHLFLTPDGWKRADVLRKGDVLGLLSRPDLHGTDMRQPLWDRSSFALALTRSHMGGKGYSQIACDLRAAHVSSPGGKGRWHPATVRQEILRYKNYPRRWRAEDFRLAGYFIGDGACGPMGDGVKSTLAALCCHDPEELADIMHCAAVLGFKVRAESTRPGNYRFTGGIQDWLRDTGLAGKRSYDKRVPPWVFTASSAMVGNFLGAYFACDGHLDLKKHTAEFYSVSRELLADVQHLLLRFGVASRLALKNGYYNQNRHISWRLTLLHNDDACWRFISRIPVYHSYKASLLSEIGQLRTRFDEPFLPDRIMDITDGGIRLCRCLTVENDASFTVNDIVVHNSGKAVIEDFQRRVLTGYSVRGIPSTGSKSDRAKPSASAAEAKNIMLVEGPWITPFLETLCLFPHGKHDDDVDVLSMGVNYLGRTEGVPQMTFAPAFDTFLQPSHWGRL